MKEPIFDFLQRISTPAIAIFLLIFWVFYIQSHFISRDTLVGGSSFLKKIDSRQEAFIPDIFKVSLNMPTSEWQVTDTIPSPEKLRNAPVSELELRVAGIISNGQCDDSLAIIERNGEQAAYRCGVIATEEGVSIVHFFFDMIIINNNGRYESLYLSVQYSVGDK